MVQLDRDRRDLRRIIAEDQTLRLRQMERNVDIIEFLDALELGPNHVDRRDVGRTRAFDARISMRGCDASAPATLRPVAASDAMSSGNAAPFDASRGRGRP
jgi:hypothetical protein